MKLHNVVSWLLFIVGLFVFGGVVGWANGDLEKILTRELYVLLFWVNVAVFAYVFNGLQYKTWSIFCEDDVANSIVFGSLVIGTGFIIGNVI